MHLNLICVIRGGREGGGGHILEQFEYCIYLDLA